MSLARLQACSFINLKLFVLIFNDYNHILTRNKLTVRCECFKDQLVFWLNSTFLRNIHGFQWGNIVKTVFRYLRGHIPKTLTYELSSSITARFMLEMLMKESLL